MKLYKIKRKSDGAFYIRRVSSGYKGDRKGSFFTLEELEHHVKAHFRYLSCKTVLDKFKDCEIIEFEIRKTKRKTNPGKLRFEKAIFEEI